MSELNVKITDLVRKVSEGDLGAFRVFFNIYYDKVCHFAEQIIGDPVLADEVAQTVFITLWKRRSVLDAHKNIDSFIYVVTKHAVLDFIKVNRKLISAERLEQIGELPSRYDEAAESVEYGQLCNIISGIVDSFPEQRKRVFMMSRYDGMSNTLIAEKLGISKRTVERHLNIALNTIRKELKSFSWLLMFLGLIDKF